MKKEKKMIGLFLLLGICAALTGCGSQEKKEEPAPQEDKVKIGLCFDTFVLERWIRDRDVFETTAKIQGAEVNVQNANGDVEQQISQIRYFIKKRMDVITIIAVDGSSLTEVVREAKEAGIKVIAYDRLIRNADVDLYISFDNEQVGRLMGEALKERLPEGGNIFAIKGPPTDNNVSQVEKGFSEAIKDSGLNVVYQQYCDAWTAELAYDAVSRGLEAYPDVAGIMCGNDGLATEAVRALTENRLAGTVVVTGQDADLNACQRIVEGTQAMTVYKPVENEAATAAEYAVKMGNDIYVSVAGTISDGTYDVPYISLDPIAVTKDNMQTQIIDTNFHSEEEVYLNIRKE
ncbi:sugar ABC transporter substrate-binding protein [Lactonifactor longoviformis]|uniref:sugar ABC transporter substrate-binding protein n=1 Tax=Lactonifactor longoviformis TaxID=341220 RepID=UPI001D01BF4F|nr:substrate-binding domain-containing protein [Lactonifactor longoviformis]MCB5711659.1 substrate-binding domain-containing protein [Lactonifactor longoviformis]MCB5715626.1 substrate-binding domain-containing protein [Lactonifactor longoviformis]